MTARPSRSCDAETTGQFQNLVGLLEVSDLFPKFLQLALGRRQT